MISSSIRGCELGAFLFVGALVGCEAVHAAELASPAPAAAATSVPAAADNETHKLEGIFNTDLPKTEAKGSLRLIVHPHFGDFTHRDYVRVPTGVRWGISEDAEINATVEPFIHHGLKHGTSGTGIGDVEVGGKYRWRQWPSADYDTSVGFNLFFPVGHPPLDMTTGYNRYSPYIVVGKRIPRHPGLTVFLNAGVNLVSKSSVAGSFERNQPHSDSFAITPGFVYDHYPFHYTLEFGYETTSVIGHGNQQYLTVRPGFAWDLPPKWKFLTASRWLIGIGFHATFGPDGTTTGGGGKIRAEFGFKRWMNAK